MWNLGNLNFSEWNLVEPGSRFRAAAPNHLEALLEEPQAFQAVGEKHDRETQEKSKAKNDPKERGRKFTSADGVKRVKINALDCRWARLAKSGITVGLSVFVGRRLTTRLLLLAELLSSVRNTVQWCLFGTEFDTHTHTLVWWIHVIHMNPARAVFR